jgi:hypothetical protein
LKLATTRATRSYGARVQLERSPSVEHRHGGIQPAGDGVGGRGGDPRQLWGARSGPLGQGRPRRQRGLDLTITEQFARSMSLEEALNANNPLC